MTFLLDTRSKIFEPMLYIFPLPFPLIDILMIAVLNLVKEKET